MNISLAVLLLVSTIGITVDKHYCADNFVGIWFYATTNACGMAMSDMDDCCHDDIKVYCVQDEFQLVSNTQSPKLQLLAYVYFPLREQHIQSPTKFSDSYLWRTNLPPPSGPDIFLKVQSFLL